MPVSKILHVVEVEVCGPHSLRVRFDDGVCKRVNVLSLLDRGELLRLRDPREFARARVDRKWGIVAWPGGLDLAPEALHELPEEPDARVPKRPLTRRHQGANGRIRRAR